MNLTDKYKPKKFSEVLGNEWTLMILKNMIFDENRPSGLMLFGPWGAGSTTIAHLIQRSLYCSERPPGAIDPCGECYGCTCTLLDFDCATITTEDFKYIKKDLKAPGYGPLNLTIWIFDQFEPSRIKMQDKFLKNLEDRDNLLLIFCAKNLNKLSDDFSERVQLLPTALPKLGELVSWLSGICSKENYTADSEALELIAKASGRRPRGCLNLLQKTSCLDKKISTFSVEQVLLHEGKLDPIKQSTYTLLDSLGEDNWVDRMLAG
jgi:DNA polymerase-3 subunit gamma/tau